MIFHQGLMDLPKRARIDDGVGEQRNTNRVLTEQVADLHDQRHETSDVMEYVWRLDRMLDAWLEHMVKHRIPVQSCPALCNSSKVN